MYKMPELTDSSHSNIREGYGYFYMDSNNMQWQLGEHFLNESNHALYYTLQQIYEHKESDVRMGTLSSIFGINAASARSVLQKKKLKTHPLLVFVQEGNLFTFACKKLVACCFSTKDFFFDNV